jgi:hypothetical protein
VLEFALHPDKAKRSLHWMHSDSLHLNGHYFFLFLHQFGVLVSDILLDVIPFHDNQRQDYHELNLQHFCLCIG